MQKILFALSFAAVLFLSDTSLAAPPKVAPLQPVEQTISDFSENVNTPGSPYHDDPSAPVLETQQEIPENPNSNSFAPTVVDESTSMSYWFFFFGGLAGLMFAIIWGYLRFLRKLQN